MSKTNLVHRKRKLQEYRKAQFLDLFYLTFDLFLFVSSSYLSNYTDGNTLYAFGFNLEKVKNVLHTDFDAVT